MARFNGRDKLGDFIDNQQVHGNAFHLLKEADAFLRRHLPIASFFQQGQFERIDKPILPVFSIREALINAICHRDYSTRAGSMTLAIFDDRLEIWNNGLLPKPLKIADLNGKHGSWPRNTLISKVFYARGLIETWGTGTNRMIQLCDEADVPAPKFEEYSGGVSVTFRFKTPIGTSKPAAPAELSTRQNEILSVLRQSSHPLSTNQILSQLQHPPTARTVQNDLAILQKIKPNQHVRQR